jgi:hypothetical protein
VTSVVSFVRHWKLKAELGKTQLLHILGKTFCIRRQLGFYCCGSSIDPHGGLSKFGITQASAFIGFFDFDMTTQRGDPLTLNEIKHLFGVFEPGDIRARYGMARFTAKTPRAFAINGDEADMGKWFIEIGLPGLAYFVTERYDLLAQVDSDQAAIARRVAILTVTEPIVSAEHVEALNEGDEDALAQEMQNEEAWCKRQRTS